MSRLGLHLLGSPRIEQDGTPISVSRRKAVALLAFLVVTGQSQSRDTLATMFWPEQSQSRARASLRSTLSILRKDLGGGPLDIEREAIRLDPEAEIWSDVAEFRARLAACRTHGHPAGELCPACLTALGEAASLYRDGFLAGFTLRDSPIFDEWQFFQGEGLRQELAWALEQLARGHAAQQAYPSAISYARRWLALDALHEPAHRTLMRLYARSGQRAAALRQYAECERVLEDELGASPEVETVALYRAIQERREYPPPATSRERTRPAASVSPVSGNNLPVQLTPFVGRQVLLADLAARLQSPACRLLTLVGPGGSGKTRLALEAAAAQLDRYAHGVYLVPLAPLETSTAGTPAAAIVPAVTAALGFTPRAATASGATAPTSQQDVERQQLLGYLSQRNVLLLLDNVEHLLPPAWTGGDVATALIGEILRAAPGVKVLATSRVQLDVQGEHVFPVPGLDVPRDEGTPDAAHYSAVELFVQSAERVSPGFGLTAYNQADVVEICRLVEGMPLGILLAAAWVSVLTPAEVAAEIRRSLDFLETDLRDLPARQRSMRAVFDHSWRLLTKEERIVMEALSVFRGGFTRQAAQWITGATLRDLRSLIAKSLLQRSPEGRYEVHELARQYAAERLAQSPAVRDAVHDRHSAYYAAALAQWATDLKGARQRVAQMEIEVEGENARAAWNWAVRRVCTLERAPVEWLDQAVEGLCRFLQRRGRYRDGEAACREAVASLEALPSSRARSVQAKALAWEGAFGCLLGHCESARQLLQRSLDLLEAVESQDTRAERAFILEQQGLLTEPTDRERARHLLEQSLALYRALDDRWGAASVLNQLGFVERLRGEYDRAWQLCQESLAIRRTLNDKSGIADSLQELGWAAIVRAQFEEGERLIRESLALSQEIGDQAHIAEGVLHLGVSLFWMGRFVEARGLLQESIALGRELGERTYWAWSHNLMGLTEAHLGQYEDACQQAEVALELYRDSDRPADLGHALLVLGHVALARKAYAAARQWLEQGVAIYREIGVLDERVWALADLAVAVYRLGDPDQARQLLYESLQLGVDISNSAPLWVTLPAIALLWADHDEVERAIELYALAQDRFPSASGRWFDDVYGQTILAAATTLPPTVVAAARERGQVRDLEATVRELLAEFKPVL